MAAGPAGSPESTPCVLVVEDEALVRLVVVEELDLLGFDVCEAGTAAAALGILEERSSGIDAAIIDVGLPDARGDELAGQIRARWPELPIIMVSGYDEAVLRNRFAGDANTSFLRKPYFSDDLSGQLERHGVVPRKAPV